MCSYEASAPVRCGQGSPGGRKGFWLILNVKGPVKLAKVTVSVITFEISSRLQGGEVLSDITGQVGGSEPSFRVSMTNYPKHGVYKHHGPVPLSALEGRSLASWCVQCHSPSGPGSSWVYKAATSGLLPWMLCFLTLYGL